MSTKYSYDIGGAAKNTQSDIGLPAGLGTPDKRRLFAFGDRVHELAPEETPFFVYLNSVSKVPTDDAVFRVLENRSKLDWTNRSFSLAADVNGGSDVVANSTYSFTVDNASGGAIDFLVKGMVLAVSTKDKEGAGLETPALVSVRVENAPTVGASSTTFQGKVIALSNAGDTTNDPAKIKDNDLVQIIGTAFEEGSGSPDTFSSDIDDTYGYTQIFKTAAEMTNTAIATVYRGYSSEWDRIWNLKLREHKVDIERAMLFNQKKRSGNIQYSDGIVGAIVREGAWKTSAASSWDYSTGKPYGRQLAVADLNYDVLLQDLEVMFDPARGGSSERLVLCGLPVLSYFNKLGGSAFLGNTVGAGAGSNLRFAQDLNTTTNVFGHKILTLETIHGTLHLVKEPLFRGFSAGYMLFADMSQMAYRPLVGNGLNRDTHIITNVQQADEDLRKDMILTEAGLEVTLMESHAMYNIADQTPLGA